MTGPSQRREMAETALARGRVSIALACRAFGVSETCDRYGPNLRAENAQSADRLVGLTASQKNLEVWVMFSAPAQCPGPFMEPQKGIPDLLRTGIEPAYQARQAAETGQTRRLGGAGSAQYDLALGLHGGPAG